MVEQFTGCQTRYEYFGIQFLVRASIEITFCETEIIIIKYIFDIIALKQQCVVRVNGFPEWIFSLWQWCSLDLNETFEYQPLSSYLEQNKKCEDDFACDAFLV